MIGVIGINHKSAPIAIREKFAFTKEQIEDFTQKISEHAYFEGCVVLSTCNRSEIYFESNAQINGAGGRELIGLLKDYKNIETDITQHFYLHNETETVHHLFHVICGFDSLALGEYQIVGQVKEAFRISDEKKTAGKGLTRLFQKSFETSKRVRTETEMNKGAASVSYAAVELAGKTFKDLQHKKILLVGAGETSELVIQHLRKRVCEDLTIVNRTLARAETLAARYNGKVRPLAELEQALVEADIILTSTGSQQALVTKEMVERVMVERNNKSLFFVDLSVPRNVEVAVENIPHVTVNDVDDLQAVVAETFERRKSQIDNGKRIIANFEKEFSEWRNAQRLSPTLQAIHQEFLAIQKDEVKGFKKFTGNTGNPDLDKFGERIAQKYAHVLARNIRELTQNGKDEETLKLVNQLFQL